MFNEATQNNYKIIFDEWYTERRVISDTITQMDIGTSQHVNSPKYFFGAHQTRIRADTANKNNNISTFDNPIPQKYYVEIDSVRYSRDSVLIKYQQNDYFEKKRFNLVFQRIYWRRTDESIYISPRYENKISHRNNRLRTSI